MATDGTGMSERLKGGCQCGAVRYCLASRPTDPGLCHCRMCQKATGGLFLASAGVPVADLVWTHGTPATFRSSSVAERGFCAACGTPLTFRYLGADRISVTLGSLDEPDVVAPLSQIGTEARVAWWASIPSLPERTTEEDQPDLGPRVVSYQHPDRETEASWAPPTHGD